ncbi:hypothetical protein ACLGL1_04855 [Peptococcus simiae]|uniref:hypothetical protein n=1 Tax=Peptococcus simiae TaxID=1643805 RepID=UPI00397EB7F6
MKQTASRLFLSLAGYWLSDRAQQAVAFPSPTGLSFSTLGEEQAYRHRFILPAVFLDQRCAFFCESMAAPAYLYINGVLAHIHYTPGKPVEFACNDLLQVGDNQLVIRFVNLPDKDTCPLLPPLNIAAEDWLALAAPLGMPKAGVFATIGIRTSPWSYIAGCRMGREEGPLTFCLDTVGELTQLYVFLVDDTGEAVYTGEGQCHTIPEGLLATWSPDQPILYQLEVQAVDNNRLMDHWLLPFGLLAPGSDIDRDLPILPLEAFCQGQTGPLVQARRGYLRLDGLTQADAYLDLCDQVGQQAILDLPPVTVYAQGLKGARRRTLLEKWLRRYGHHPCIQAWGLGENSSGFSAEDLGAYRALVDRLDPFQRPLLTEPLAKQKVTPTWTNDKY